MCGIAATFGTADEARLGHMLDAMRHRGPDARRGTTVGRAALGIDRLAIVDRAGGDQPLHDPGRGSWVVGNGEIYNHRELRAGRCAAHPFRTGSDVEVILPLYAELGRDCVHELDGMFAFALYDARDDTFLVARDRFGIKPLYYVEHDDGLCVASEVKAFLGAGLPLERVRALPPGCMITPDGVRRWYRVEERRTPSAPDPARVRALLEESVRKHLLADPDIGVGVLLSGGLDSSIVAALATRRRPDLVAFTVGMPGSPDVDVARKVASHLGIRLVERVVEHGEIRARLPRAVWETESYNQALVLEGMLTGMLAETVRAEGVTVVLSGEGADEIFAGYESVRSGVAPHRIDRTLRTLVAHIGETECRRLDRATMAHSIEARVPFLDPALVEYAINLPHARDDLRTGPEKAILRRACEDLLPPEIVWRDKLAFDHGSGVLHLLEDAERRAAPDHDADAEHPLVTELRTLWLDRFAGLGGDRAHEMFGVYPVMQEALDQRDSRTWDTVESADPDA